MNSHDSLNRRIRRLLKRRGYRLTQVIRDGLRDFIATVYEENPHIIGAEPSDSDEDDVRLSFAPQQHPITCPHCGEPIAIDIDLSGDDQDDVQDCTVCCSPIHVTYSVRAGRMVDFMSEPY